MVRREGEGGGGGMKPARRVGRSDGRRECFRGGGRGMNPSREADPTAGLGQRRRYPGG